LVRLLLANHLNLHAREVVAELRSSTNNLSVYLTN